VDHTLPPAPVESSSLTTLIAYAVTHGYREAPDPLTDDDRARATIPAPPGAPPPPPAADARAWQARIQRAMVFEYRSLVATLIRRRGVPEPLRDEAIQVGMLGVLVALERFNPDAGGTLRSAAWAGARAEIDRWLACAVEAS
jgi:hypothetical protein